jgi:Protein of unknown function (DUF1211).
MPSSPPQLDDHFRLRGAAITRLDVFSDVVLGIALVLLVVSLAIPRSFSDLRSPTPSFTASAICFLMLVNVWYSHCVFFRRYGLSDRWTVLLNAALLGLVLFCVYPLKFLYAALFTALVRAEDLSPRFAAAVQVNGMMVLYALGFAVIFFLVAALYWNAWRQRDALVLDGIERLLTISSIVDALGIAAIGLIACLAALILPTSWVLYSALLYFLMLPWKALNSIYFGRKARHLRSLINPQPGLP